MPILFEFIIANKFPTPSARPTDETPIANIVSGLESAGVPLSDDTFENIRIKLGNSCRYLFRKKQVPTLEQIKVVIVAMPHGTAIEMRDRAIVAFTILSGARDDAIASLSMHHVDWNKRKVFQDNRVVRTKSRKTFTTCFFPVGDEIETIAREWAEHLIEAYNFGPDDPLFIAFSNRHLPALGYPISTRIRCEAPWHNWAKGFALRRNNSRLGAKIWGMNRC